MELEEVKQKLRTAMELMPLEQEEFLEKLAEESGRKKTRLKEQLDIFIKEKINYSFHIKYT